MHFEPVVGTSQTLDATMSQQPFGDRKRFETTHWSLVRRAHANDPVALEDLLRFDEQQRARQRAALDELARIDADLGL